MTVATCCGVAVPELQVGVGERGGGGEGEGGGPLS